MIDYDNESAEKIKSLKDEISKNPDSNNDELMESIVEEVVKADTLTTIKKLMQREFAKSSGVNLEILKGLERTN